MRRPVKAVPHGIQTAEVVWVALLAPLLLFPGRLLPAQWQWLPVLATMLFWPVRWAIAGAPCVRTPLRVPVLVLLLCLPVAIWVALDRPHAWEIAGYLMLGVAAANALTEWHVVRRRPQWIAWGLIAVAAALSLVGPLIITEVIDSARVVMPLQRALAPIVGPLGETINPNILANVLLMAMPYLMALFLAPGWTQRRWIPPLMILLFLWLAAILVFTESRGAWIALFVVIPLLIGLRWKRLLWLLPAALIAGVIGLFRAGPGFIDKLASGASISGLAQREEIWQRTLFLIHDFPLTGAGLGMFRQVVPVLYPYTRIDPSLVIPDAHNLPLQVGADLGVVGLVAWMALIIVQVAMLCIVLRSRTESSPPTAWALTWVLAAGSLAATAGMLVSGVFSAMNWGVKPAFLPWMVTALAVILHRRSAGVDCIGSDMEEGLYAPD